MNRRRFLAVAGGAVALYVSRGIGTSVVPVRFGSPPEVAVFTMWV